MALSLSLQDNLLLQTALTECRLYKAANKHLLGLWLQVLLKQYLKQYLVIVVIELMIRKVSRNLQHPDNKACYSQAF